MFQPIDGHPADPEVEMDPKLKPFNFTPQLGFKSLFKPDHNGRRSIGNTKSD